MLRASDPIVAQEFDRLCRNSIESQQWATGDMFYVGTVTREGSRADRIITGLTIGASGKIARSDGVAPTWSTATYPNTAIRGDIIRASAANTWSAYALGASGMVLRSDGIDIAYSTFTIPNTFAAGDLVYASAANVLAGLAIGGAGTVLGITAGVPAWQTPSTYLAHNLLSATHGDSAAEAVAVGAMIYGENPAAWTRLAPGGQGDVLVIKATTPLGAAGNCPNWLARGGAGALLMSNGADSVYATTLTGTYTMSAAGTALTINNDLQVSRSVGIGVAAPAVSSALSIGAHGQTLAANDVAWGSSGTNYVFWDNSSSELGILGQLGVGTQAVPHGGIGGGIIAIEGANANLAAGPHVQITTATDDRPLVQVLAWAHNNIRIGFDTYYTGSWIAAETNAFAFYKTGGNFLIYGNSGLTPGSAYTPTVLVTILPGSTGGFNITGYQNTGTTILATAQGDAAFGKSAGNQLFWDESAGGLGVNVTVPIYRLDVGAAILSGTQATALRAGVAGTYASAAALTYDVLNMPAHTVTLTGTTGMTAACAIAGLRLGIVTVTDASAITVDNGASLYIAGPVAQAGSVTITNKYALFVDDGTTRLDGVLDHNGSQIGFFNTTLGSQQTYTPTNDVTMRSFDPNTVSLVTLANVVATMLRDSCGLFGV